MHLCTVTLKKANACTSLQVRRNRGRNTTLVASITLSGMGETMAVEGSMSREVFEAYVVESALAPTLEVPERW